MKYPNWVAQNASTCRPSCRQRPTCAASEPPGLTWATTMLWANSATSSLRSVASRCVNRAAIPTLLTTAICPFASGAAHSGGSLAPATGRASTTTAGLPAAIKTFNTDCSSGEWKPLITARLALACCKAQSMAARIAVPGHWRDAKNAVNSKSSNSRAPQPISTGGPPHCQSVAAKGFPLINPFLDNDGTHNPLIYIGFSSLPFSLSKPKDNERVKSIWSTSSGLV